GAAAQVIALAMAGNSSRKRVSIMVGLTALMVILLAAYSLASARINPSCACFTTVYMDMNRGGTRAVTVDSTNTTLARGNSAIFGNRRLRSATAERTWMFMSRSKSPTTNLENR